MGNPYTKLISTFPELVPSSKGLYAAFWVDDQFIVTGINFPALGAGPPQGKFSLQALQIGTDLQRMLVPQSALPLRTLADDVLQLFGNNGIEPHRRRSIRSSGQQAFWRISAEMDESCDHPRTKCCWAHPTSRRSETL